jgi:hypothetical protein
MGNETQYRRQAHGQGPKVLFIGHIPMKKLGMKEILEEDHSLCIHQSLVSFVAKCPLTFFDPYYYLTCRELAPRPYHDSARLTRPKPLNLQRYTKQFIDTYVELHARVVSALLGRAAIRASDCSPPSTCHKVRPESTPPIC